MAHRRLIAQPPPRPAVYAALALMAGLAAGFRLPVPWVAPAAAGLACLAGGGRQLWRSRRIHGPLPGSGIMILLTLGLLGWAQAAYLAEGDRAALAAVDPWAEEALVCIEGTLAEEPRQAPECVSLVLEAPTIKALRAGVPPGGLELKVAISVVEGAARGLNSRPEALPLPGQRVRAWGRLRPILPPTTPNPFDPEQAALGKGIGARLAVTRTGDLELGPAPDGVQAAFFTVLRRARRQIVETLSDRLPADQLPMARALLLGEAHLVPLPEREAYALTGLAHLLAVSGLNTAFVLLLVICATRLAGLSPRGSAWVGIAGVLAYAALTGFEPPVARAAVMGIFFLAGYLLKRVTTPLASLATAALATLLADPRNLTRVDWQLSYACVLAIVLLTPPIHEVISSPLRRERAPGEPPAPAGWWRYWVNQLFLLPLAGLIAVHLGIFPLQVGTFRQYNLLSPLYNMLCCGLSLAAMLGAGLTALLGAIPGLGWLVALPTRGALGLMAWLVGQMAAVPHAILSLVPPGAVLTIAYYGVLLGGSWLRGGEGSDGRLNRPQIMNFVMTCGGLAALVCWTQILIGPGSDGLLNFYLLDVGQGDAAVARFPNGRLMVVDAGPTFGENDRGRQTVGPFLQTLGVSTIDCLVATHGDADHVGGIPYLLERFEVGLLLEGPDIGSSAAYRKMREVVAKQKINARPARLGDTLTGFGAANVKLLGPIEGRADNNASLVMLVEYGETQILLTGDLEAGGERELVKAGLIGDVEVLKLGHHGSRTASSEALLAEARPEAAMVSVGKNNRYGHPSPEVMGRLEEKGIPVFRTDELGALWLRSDGKRVSIYRYAGP